MGPLITICARGGSQGVKDKNIRPLLGRPLIAHSIDCALRWGRADRVVVSTDSEDIARVARASGAEAPFIRPANLAGGHVPKMAAVRHALHQIEQGTDTRYEVVIDLDVTAPLRHVSDVENAFNLLITRGPLTVFSVVNARKNPYYNVVEADSEGFVHVVKDGVIQLYDTKADATAHNFASTCGCLLNPAAGTFGSDTARTGAFSSHHRAMTALATGDLIALSNVRIGEAGTSGTTSRWKCSGMSTHAISLARCFLHARASDFANSSLIESFLKNGRR